MITNNIITDRLILKTMIQDDAEKAWSIWGDLEMGKYLNDPFYESVEVLWELLDDAETGSDYSFLAYCKHTDAFIGTCSIGPEKIEGEWGIGYCVHKDYWGKGYATEMAKALINFGMTMGIRQFTGTVAIENEGSRRVMQKCGMQVAHQGTFRKQETDITYVSEVYKMQVSV